MTAILFVHGTGVRSPVFESSFVHIAHELQSRRSDLTVVPCFWGETLGARLHAHGASIPHYDTARSLEEIGDDAIHDEDEERTLWALLYEDPLYELRLLALRTGISQDDTVQTVPILGRLSSGDVLDERVRTLVVSPKLETALHELGIAPVFSQARHILVTSTPYHTALQTAPDDALGAYRTALARSLTALSLVLCEQRQQQTPRLWDASLRDEVVMLLNDHLGGTDRSIPTNIAKFVVAHPLTTRSLRRQRRKLNNSVLPAAGDILLYQARGEPIRQFIRQHIEQLDPPVVLLAHSLGGIACVDLLVQQAQVRRQVQLIVTVGSQVPFFYEIGALQSLPPDATLPDDFPFWLNIYDLNDFLSYIGAQVFPNKVQDERVDNRQPFPQAHGAYWTNPATWNAIMSRLP